MFDEGSEFKFVRPWFSTADRGAEFEEAFLRQLKLEVSPGHVLFDLPVALVGRDGASDDTLFEILDGSGRLALVHLTWSRGQERLPWPATVIYPDFAMFAEHLMAQQEDDRDSREA